MESVQAPWWGKKVYGSWTLKDIVSRCGFPQELHFKKGEIEYLKKSWVEQAYASTYCGNNRGIGIQIHKNTPFSLISQHMDQEGHFLLLNCTLHGEKYTLISL